MTIQAILNKKYTITIKMLNGGELESKHHSLKKHIEYYFIINYLFPLKNSLGDYNNALSFIDAYDDYVIIQPEIVKSSIVYLNLFGQIYSNYETIFSKINEDLEIDNYELCFINIFIKTKISCINGIISYLTYHNKETSFFINELTALNKLHEKINK